MMMLGGRAGGGVGPGGGVGGGRCPFTASQWQELEHQALIYKYMASGVPIPSDLLLPLRRSFLLDSALATSPSLGFPPQAALGWGCFGMGFGRKAEDPEPGRCRRTDGKKWRCSKEAYPDSKYCEKHMHRGKNRSRKPVEMSLATPPPPSSSASSSSSNVHSAVNVATTTSSPAPSYHRAVTHDATPYHALYGGPYASASRQQQQHAGAYHQHAAAVAAAQVSPFHLHLETTHTHPPPSYYSRMDHSKDTYAYGHSVKEVHGGGEHAFFTDTTTDRDVAHHQHHASAGQWQFKQLGGMEPKQQPLFPGCNNGGGGYGSNNNNNSAAAAYGIDLSGAKDREDEEKERRQHCFLLGTDLRLDKPSSCDEQKPLRPFFDEWPHEKAGSKGSWMGLEGETQLSISIPMSANDLPITTTSRYHHGE